MRKNTPEQDEKARVLKAEYNKKWARANREVMREHSKKSYGKHRKEILAGRIDKREMYKRYNLYRHYGITLEEYNATLEEQGGVCAICGGVNIDGRRLAVDHDHITDALRGLLCSNCNFTIGLIKEDVRIAQSTIDYLNGYKQ